jgi:hypothetical protein
MVRRFTRSAALTALAGALLTTALTWSGGATPAHAACTYTVAHNPSGIHENPSLNSVIRDYKAAFRTLSGPCQTHRDTSGTSVVFVAVYDGYCTDGIGWIRRSYLF